MKKVLKSTLPENDSRWKSTALIFIFLNPMTILQLHKRSSLLGWLTVLKDNVAWYTHTHTYTHTTSQSSEYFICTHMCVYMWYQNLMLWEGKTVGQIVF